MRGSVLEGHSGAGDCCCTGLIAARGASTGIQGSSKTPRQASVGSCAHHGAGLVSSLCWDQLPGLLCLCPRLSNVLQEYVTGHCHLAWGSHTVHDSE